MAKHLANDDRMWGHYDAVHHGHENARMMPHGAVEMIGDYEEMVPNVQSLGGFGNFALPSIGMPVVRNQMRYADPALAQAILFALRASVLQPVSGDAYRGTLSLDTQASLLGTPIPALPPAGAGWAEQAVQAGKAVLVEIAPKDPLKPVFMVTSNPGAVAEAAWDPEGKFVILGIGPALDAAAAAMHAMPVRPQPNNDGSLSTNAKIAIGVGVAAVIGIFVYASRK
jgi:hypothetical protein